MNSTLEQAHPLAGASAASASHTTIASGAAATSQRVRRAGPGAALGQHLQQDFGDTPLGHGQHQSRQLDRELILAARLGSQNARQKDAHGDTKDQNGETAQALPREGHAASVC